MVMLAPLVSPHIHSQILVGVADDWRSELAAFHCHRFSSPGNIAVLSAEQNHKVDTSIHYNIPELQSSSRLPLPQHNGQQEPPAMRKGPLTQETDQDSEEEEEEEDGEEDDEEPPRRKWQGIEAIFEAYQEHIEGTKGREEQNEGPVKSMKAE